MYRNIMQIVVNLFLMSQIAHLVLNKISFDEFMLTLIYTLVVANLIIKGFFIMVKQNELEELKKTIDLHASQLQNKQEKDVHTRYCNFMRYPMHEFS